LNYGYLSLGVAGPKNIYNNPFFGLGGTIHEKGTPSLKSSSGSLKYFFLPFQARETQMYEKGPCGVFLYVSFSNSLNIKKIPNCTFVGLVKILNDSGYVTMMSMSFSFLGLVKLTRSDLSEG